MDWKDIKKELPLVMEDGDALERVNVLVFIKGFYECDQLRTAVFYRDTNTFRLCGHIYDKKFTKENNFEIKDSILNSKITHWTYIKRPEGASND